MTGDETALQVLVDTAAKATFELVRQPGLRASAVAAAKRAGMTYREISVQLEDQLREMGLSPEEVAGAGVGPDNLRKITARNTRQHAA